jgi:phosphate uptake regulator
MKRKVIQLAGKTLVVSLPNKWAKKYGIKKGDDVDVLDKEGNLLISLEYNSAIKKLAVHLEKDEPIFQRYLVMAYVKGCDELEITSANLICIDEIKKSLNKFLGFEIVEQSERRVLIKMISELVEGEFDSILRRTFLINKAMGTDLSEALRSKNIYSLKNIAGIEETNNKFTNFCLRTIHKSINIDKEKAIFLCLTIDGLEKIADCYRDICLSINKNLINKIDKKITDYLIEINKLYDSYYNLFYNFKPETVRDIRNKRTELIEEGNELFKELKGEQLITLSLLMQMLLILHHSAILSFPNKD